MFLTTKKISALEEHRGADSHRLVRTCESVITSMSSWLRDNYGAVRKNGFL